MAWTTTHIGFGKFKLGDLLPGETFRRFDGSTAQVVKRQPKTESGKIEVWIDVGTANARRLFLHPTALVYAETSEQAKRIVRRVQKRNRQRKKGR